MSPAARRGRERGSRPTVHVYAICWNDMRMLPYFLRHYRGLASTFYLYDDGSDDGTQSFLAAQPDVVVEPFPKDPDSFELSAVRLYDSAWKEHSRHSADWVIICDIDEHLHHPDLDGYLERCRRSGVTAVPAIGYQMVSEQFPSSDARLVDSVVRGTRWTQMDKLILFDPNAIDSINYEAGRHAAHPTGRVKFPVTPELKLLHYRYLGLEYVLSRNHELGPRMGPGDIERNFGHKYRWSDQQVTADFNAFMADATVVV